MAVAKFAVRVFASPKELQVFVSTDASVASVVSVCTDNNGQYVLFYMTP